MDDCLNEKSGKNLIKQITRETGVVLHDCYQCGKCSAGCPMAHAMDLMPREVVHYMQLGMMDEVLKSKTIWLCATCHTCVDRCPNDIDIPSLMEKSRQEAKRRGLVAVKEVDRFNDIFMENVKLFGKSQEVILEGLYNVSTGHFIQDMENVPHMLSHKLIGIKPVMIRDRGAVQKIIRKTMKDKKKK
ncbi:4Fe-4S dicluster domain-containing protein [Parasporobacterium paucivorans]|uniref:Heterodisulfide reductase subunit C n=1 Tax=Parasporobacterium paucivorans DSM 15970 TaxID=1122934 RepID=A0A1M6DGN6_9FIRM|nr:4Fe-4S dicluster domain-containing protein [Parasporobacterium paucivorans]SHI72507.1 heterodisulfide reductase subunit C [Parasporobacterium paucivorans DSM 15970]